MECAPENINGKNVGYVFLEQRRYMSPVSEGILEMHLPVLMSRL